MVLLLEIGTKNWNCAFSNITGLKIHTHSQLDDLKSGSPDATGAGSVVRVVCETELRELVCKQLMNAELYSAAAKINIFTLRQFS